MSKAKVEIAQLWLYSFVLYRIKLRDINRSNDDMNRYSDGYEIAQETMLFLCQHMGKRLDDVYVTKTGRKDTQRRTKERLYRF